MHDHEKELARIKEGLEKAKGLKIRAEMKREELLRKRQEIEEQCQQLGIKVEDLQSEIARLEGEIAANLAEADRLIPWDLVAKG